MTLEDIYGYGERNERLRELSRELTQLGLTRPAPTIEILWIAIHPAEHPSAGSSTSRLNPFAQAILSESQLPLG